MKKTLILLACCLLALGACQRPEKRVQAVAETFLHAYYTADYATAAAQCTPRLAALVSQGTEDPSVVPDDLAQTMKEALSRTSFQIISVEMDEDAASARVHYELSVPDVDKPVPMTLVLQLEGGTARVDRIE
jgi:hypothetical protein